MAAAVAERTSYGPAVERFSTRYIRQTKGRWRGLPLTFEAFQSDFLFEAMEVNPATGLRWYQEVLLGLPRKNGKTTMAGAVGLYLLLGDGEGSPEVYAAAASKDQARALFDQARKFVQGSPALLEMVRPRQYHLECPANDGLFRVLASDAPLAHGLNPSGNVIDELWAHRDGELYTALTTGSGAREQPFTLTITTAGYDETSALGVFYSRMLLAPEVERRSPYLTIARDRANGVLMAWYGAPDDDDPDDPKVWLAANPASWITEDYLRRERNKPTMRDADYRRLHLNQWTRAEQLWLPKGTWRALYATPATHVHALQVGREAVLWECPFDHELPLGVAIDMGQTYDSTGVVLAQRQPSVDKVVLRSFGWTNPFHPEHHSYGSWRVNTEEVRALLRQVYALFPVPQAAEPDSERPAPGPAFAYDPWHFSESAQLLEQEGLNMVEFPQYAARMVPASELFYELATTARLSVDAADTTLAQHVDNAVAQMTPRGWRIAKGKVATRRVDRAVAAAMAVVMAVQEPPVAKVRKARTMATM